VIEVRKIIIHESDFYLWRLSLSLTATHAVVCSALVVLFLNVNSGLQTTGYVNGKPVIAVVNGEGSHSNIYILQALFVDLDLKTRSRVTVGVGKHFHDDNSVYAYLWCFMVSAASCWLRTSFPFVWLSLSLEFIVKSLRLQKPVTFARDK
jgi:hypothetical protein